MPACKPSPQIPLTLLPSMSANSLRRVWHVELPLGGQFKVILVFVGEQHNPEPPPTLTSHSRDTGDATWTPVLYMYENAFEYAQMGYALAIAFVLFLASLRCWPFAGMRFLRTRQGHPKDGGVDRTTRLNRSMGLPTAHRLRGVKGVTHYAVLIFIGVMALFPHVLHGRERAEERHPGTRFCLSLAKPFGTFYSQAWGYSRGRFPAHSESSPQASQVSSFLACPAGVCVCPHGAPGQKFPVLCHLWAPAHTLLPLLSYLCSSRSRT